MKFGMEVVLNARKVSGGGPHILAQWVQGVGWL